MNVELTLDELNMVIKSVGITLDVTAKKLGRLANVSPVRDATLDEFRTLSAAMDMLRNAQEEAIYGK